LLGCAARRAGYPLDSGRATGLESDCGSTRTRFYAVDLLRHLRPLRHLTRPPCGRPSRRRRAPALAGLHPPPFPAAAADRARCPTSDYESPGWGNPPPSPRSGRRRRRGPGTVPRGPLLARRPRGPTDRACRTWLLGLPLGPPGGRIAGHLRHRRAGCRMRPDAGGGG
jgi:hypothetical protein